MRVRCWCGRWLGDARRIDATLIELSDLSDPAASGPRGRWHIDGPGRTTTTLRIKITGGIELDCPRHGPHTVTGADLDRALRHRHRDFRVPKRPAL